jgi:hypothetical protein
MCDNRNPERGPMFQVGNEKKLNVYIFLTVSGIVWVDRTGLEYTYVSMFTVVGH